MEFAMYAYFTDTVRKKGIDYAASYAKQLGMTGVEFLAITSNPDYCPIKSADQAREVKKVLDSYGLPTVCFSVSADLWYEPDAEEKLMHYVQIAAALGSPLFHHTLLNVLTLKEDAPAFEQVLEPVVAAAARVADYAASFGMTCIYEDQGYYFNGVHNFGIFYDAISRKCKNIGVCGDVGNCLFVNERPEVFFGAFASQIRHVHIKDYLFRNAWDVPEGNWYHVKDGNWLKETVPGTGVVDFEACMKILRSVGYEGAFSIESSLMREDYGQVVSAAAQQIGPFL